MRTQVLFWLALLFLLAAALNGVSGPWELGWRGLMGGQWAEGAVVYYLKYGLDVTGLYPTIVIENGDELKRIVNWHHPATYWLYLAAPASVFGNSPMVLRLAHLLIWIPSLYALRQLVIVRVGAAWANVTALLFATTPIVAYYGPMVVQTGAIYSLGLVSLWRFDCWMRHPGARNASLALVCFFVTCMTDYTACWWGAAVAVLALGLRSPRRYLVHVGCMAIAGFSAVTLIVFYYGLEFGGPVAYLRMLAGLGNEHGGAIEWPRALLALRKFLLGHGTLPVLALAVVGVVALVWSRRAGLGKVILLAVSVAAPGVLDCVMLPRHALGHVFWPMQTLSAVALLAAAVAVPAAQNTLAGRRLWRLGAVAVAATACWGVVWTHHLVWRYTAPPEPQRHVLQQVAPLLDGCTWTFSNLPKTTQLFFNGSWVVTEIASPEKLYVVRQVARAQGVTGELAFVLDRTSASDRLIAAVEQLGPATVEGVVEVYRFRP